MKNATPLDFNSLITHIKNSGISIDTKKDLLNLMNSGYYHLYKGYKYISSPTYKVKFNSFDEVLALYRFDNELKSLFYSEVMFLETALKSRYLNDILTYFKISSTNNILLQIYNNLTISLSNSNKPNKNIIRFNNTRNEIFNSISKAYSKNNNIVTHFLNKGEDVPLWGLFEIISLGQFGNFIRVLPTNFLIFWNNQ